MQLPEWMQSQQRGGEAGGPGQAGSSGGKAPGRQSGADGAKRDRPGPPKPAPPTTKKDADADAAPRPPDPEPAAPPAPTAKPSPGEAPAPAAATPATGEEILGLLSQVEAQLKRLAGAQKEHEAHLADRTASAREARDQPTLAELEERERELHAMRKRLADLEAQRKELVAQTEEAESVHRRLREAEGEIEGLTGAADAARRELEETRARLEEATAELAHRSGEVESLRKELEDLRQHADDAAQGNEGDAPGLQAELAQREQELASLRQRLEEAEAERPPAPAPPAGTAELVERQRRQIERLTEQLAVLKSESSPEAIEERDARIAELEEALETAGGKSGVGGRLRGAMRQGRRRDGGPGGGSEAMEGQIDELEAECERLRDEARRAAEEAQQLREAAAQSAETGDEVDKLRARVEELEEALAGAEAEDGREPASATAGEGEGDAEFFRARIGELEAEVAELRRQRGEQKQTHLRQAREIREQWTLLRDQKTALATAERRIQRAWARQRSIVVIGWLLGIAVVAAGAAWLLAGRLFPPTLAATAYVEAERRLGGPVDEEAAQRWLGWHKQLLGSEGFHRRLADRFDERQIEAYANAEAVGRLLAKNLTVEAAEPGRMVLTLAGKSPRRPAAVLDVVATTLALESSRRVGSRNDDTIAVLRGERREDGRVRYAALRRVPIRDARPVWATVFFAVLLATGAFLFTRVYPWLLRTRRIMDDDDGGGSGQVVEEW